MLSRAVFVLAMVASAMAARQVDFSTAKRKVNFVIRNNDRFSGFNQFLKRHSPSNLKTDDSDDDLVIAFAVTNAAMERNTDRLRNDPSGTYVAASHVARVAPDNVFGIETGMSADEINQVFKQEAALQSSNVLGEVGFGRLPPLLRNLNTGEFDLVLHRNRFNAYVNGLVVEEVISCADGYIMVVDGLLKNPTEDYGTYSLYTVLASSSGNPRFSHFSRSMKYMLEAFNPGGPVTDEEALDDLIRPLAMPGKKRQAAIIALPLNRAMKQRSVGRQLRKLELQNFNAGVKVMLNHVCFVPKGEGYLNRADIVEKASASPDGWSCTNALGNELVFTVSSGKYDGLAVNGIPIGPAIVDASFGRDTVLALDGVVIPDLKDVWRGI